MERGELLQVLRESLNPSSSNAINARSRVAKLPPDMANDLFIHEISRPIESLLSKSEPFIDGGFLIHSDNGYSGFYANEASIILSNRVLQGSTPEQAVSWLEKIISTDSANGIGVMAIRGVKVASSVDLGVGVTLLPFSELPESPKKNWFTQIRDSRVALRIPNFSYLSPPMSALICAHTVRPFITSTKQGEPPVQSDPLRNYSLLDDARLALTLIGPSIPINAGYWFQFDDPDLNEALLFGGIMTSHLEVLPLSISTDVELNPDDTKRFASAFLQQGEPFKTKFRLSLQRFNQALRRPPHGDRALDLTIALESLLVNGIGENTYKIGLRSALLLGGPLEKRRKVRSIVSALYSIRSALIHNGVMPDNVKIVGEGKRTAPSVVIDATEICAQLLRSILELGSIPNWYDFEILNIR